MYDGVIQAEPSARDFLHDDRILEVVACGASRNQVGDAWSPTSTKLSAFEGAILRTRDERHQGDGADKGQDNSGQQADNSFARALQLVLRAWGVVEPIPTDRRRSTCAGINPADGYDLVAAGPAPASHEQVPVMRPGLTESSKNRAASGPLTL